MERLSLCSKILYDRDLLICKKKLHSLEYPVVNITGNLDHFKNIFFEKVEKSITKHVYSEQEYLVRYWGLSYGTVTKICDDISEYLTEITNKPEWSNKISHESIYGLITGLFQSFIQSDTWEMLYDLLDKGVIIQILYENVYWHIEHCIFSKILQK
jgi:hypothetical protein